MTNPIQAIESWIASSPPGECPALLGELERLKALTHLRMMNGPNQAISTQPASEGQYLTVQQVCERFNVTAKWLYRHKRQMPHSQPSRKVLLFPEKAIEKWFASRKVH